MDSDLIRVEAIPQETRRRVFDYVVNVKGVKPSSLGYDKTYLNKIKHGIPIVENFGLKTSLPLRMLGWYTTRT